MSDEIIVPEQPRTPELASDAKMPEIVRHELATGRYDPQTAKQMLDLQIAWEEREAKKEFMAGFSRLKFPDVEKTKKGLNSDYPPLEEIQKITGPILEAEGFGVTFTSSKPDEKGLIAITGILSHRLGHSRETTVYQPIGTVSKGMNANQAIGSAVSYGQRYCLKMMLNLRFVGMDNDAQSMSLLTDRELNSIEDLLGEIGQQHREGLLKFVRYKSVSDIQRGAYGAALSWLEAMRRKIGQKSEPPR